MKREILALLPFLLLFPFLAAFSPPCIHKQVEIYLDDEKLAAKELTVEPSHAMRAKSAGGYEMLYERLLDSYEAREALNYLARGLGDYLSAECKARRVDPLNATLEWNGKISSPFIYYAERSGRETDLVTLGREVARAMDMDTHGIARARSHEVTADVTEAKLRAVTREISRFSTSYASSGESRRHNIALAAKAINGTVLAAGEVFSFNETVGARTAERGFREANIVVNGEFTKGVGGGVCQVSTTLYNAVLLASRPIENAAAHSIPVSYVDYSRDCTVSSAIDFRFRNASDHPLYIAAFTKGSTLTFVLYGEKTAEPCALESEIVTRIPYRALYADGTEVKDVTAATLLSPGREGIKSRLYRISGGKRTLIRENYYAGKNAVYQKAA